MYKWNRVIQTIFIGIYLFILLASFAQGDGMSGSWMILTMLWLFPIGVTQFLGSIIDVAEKGKDGLLYHHLIFALLSLITLFLSYIFYKFGITFLGDILVFLGFSGAGIMLFYYWYLVFFGYKTQKREMEIIQKLRKETKNLKS